MKLPEDLPVLHPVQPCALRDEAALAIRPSCALEEAELRLPLPDVAAEVRR